MFKLCAYSSRPNRGLHKVIDREDSSEMGYGNHVDSCSILWSVVRRLLCGSINNQLCRPLLS